VNMGKLVGGESYGDVLTQKRADDWIAFLRVTPAVWDAGRTEAQALGKLLITLHSMGYSVRLQKQQGA
jgi:hypothetical protein